MAAGSPMCIPVGVPYQANWQDLDADTVTFRPGVIEDAAAALLDTGQPLRFDFDHAVSPAAADTWLRTSGLVKRVALANAERASGGVLLIDELTRLLASTALTCFPNTTMADLGVKPARTTPESLRRAVAFIDANLDQPLNLATIAEAARVSPRALNTTFNRHHDMPLMAYVRRARLDRAHHDLTNAQPGESVTEIAARWGFYSLPRFGVHYRRAYGQPPSQTLRHS